MFYILGYDILFSGTKNESNVSYYCRVCYDFYHLYSITSNISISQMGLPLLKKRIKGITRPN